ncbi:MAG TPA: 16S rRNA (guanine(966)-N(2))-methyltransferase RsmD [Actinomycetota bacterium]|nr:16S rRNA (guanine(966)-N(2))-methyltransferase RsmD [Actinomycetota bacterium]
MRIIAGTAKGTRLGPVPAGTRPVSDRAREGLFASLGARVEAARVLDLFAGTGALGIEALSRGASTARFVDASPDAVAAIRDNLARSRKEGVAQRADVLRALRSGRGPEDPFDLVFVDPPYETPSEDLAACLAELDRGWLPDDGWTVIVTRGQKGSLPAVPLHWAVARQLRYGDSLLTLYREVGWA